MRISPKLKWLIPYLELSASMLPHGKKIVRVGAWSRTNKRMGRDVQAQIITDDWISYRIWTHTERHPRGQPIQPYSKIDILALIAHELAHTLDMDHSPQHKILESNILNMFMKKLESEGYKSEEDELGT